MATDNNNADGISRPLIFILDDDPAFGRLMREALLHRLDCTVRDFVDLKDMVADPDLESVDLFIIDIQLNDFLTGFQVPAELPLRCRFAAFLFVSGFPIDRPQYDMAAESVFFDFIAKPFPMVLFVHRIKILLAARMREPKSGQDKILDLWTRPPYVALVLDAKMQVRLANHQLADLLQVESPRALVGRPWSEFFPHGGFDEFQQAHFEILKGDLSKFGELSNNIQSSTGKIYRIKWFNSPFTGSENDEILTLSVGILSDVKKDHADELRQTWHKNILLHRAAIRAIKKLPDIKPPESVEGGSCDIDVR